MYMLIHIYQHEVLGQGSRTLMGPEPRAPKRPGPRAARAQGSVSSHAGQFPRLGRADGPYIGVYNTNLHVGGQIIAAATGTAPVKIRAFHI